MSREIKFRAWDKEAKVMQPGYFSVTWDGQVIDGTGYDTGNGDHLIPMQYTGLKDKNGKEIYQGDILSLNNKNYDPEYKLFYEGIVEVTSGVCGFGLSMVNPKSNDVDWDSSSMWHVGEEDTTEVIGNIYENPELLR